MFDLYSIIVVWMLVFFFFKQKTAYEMRISDWSSDVCSSDLVAAAGGFVLPGDTVDVFVTRTLQDPMGGASQQITDVMLQGTRDIAIDQNANDTSKDPAVGKTATPEVNQVDAQNLASHTTVGNLPQQSGRGTRRDAQ